MNGMCAISRVIGVAMAAGVALTASSPALAGDDDACVETADLLNRACAFAVRDDFFVALAVCENLGDESEEDECERDARLDRRAAAEECALITERRIDLCAAVGGGAYAPPFGEDFADQFVDPLQIGIGIPVNPYFPLQQGNRWVYEVSEDGEVLESITVEVRNEVKLIQGVRCVTVSDIVRDADGQLIENTDDWYAQDLAGDIWYCGEIAQNFERFEGDEPENAELTDIDGSWKSGRDGAKAGILLPFAPQVGDVIRQEVAWGNAEDVIEIMSVTGSEGTAVASCKGNCLVTRDFTPVAEGEAFKYYAPGTGLIVEDEGAERVDLVEFTQSP